PRSLRQAAAARRSALSLQLLIRHSRARGNPEPWAQHFAWIPAFAGMTRWIASAPQRRFGRVKGAAVITQARYPVLRQQQRRVEIDDGSVLSNENRRRHRQRGADHAA